MHFFVSRRSERHAQARRTTAGPIAVKHTRIEPVSLRVKPVPRSGTRTFLALAFSEAPRISCRPNVDNQKSVLISLGRHPIPLSFKRSTWSGDRSNSDEC